MRFPAKSLVFAFLILFVAASVSGSTIVRVGMNEEGGDGGVYIDVTIEKVEVSKYEIQRGKEVVFRLFLHNRSDVDPDDSLVLVRSGGKTLVSRLVSMEGWDVHDRKVVEIAWNTGEAQPGEYVVEVEVLVSGDVDEFDNTYRVEEPIIVR